MFIQLQKEFLGKAIGERIDISEAHAKTLIADGTAQAVTDDLITPAIDKAMEGAATAFQASFDKIVNAKLKAFEKATTMSRKNAVPAIFGEGNTGDIRHNFVDFLKCVHARDYDTIHKQYGYDISPESGMVVIKNKIKSPDWVPRIGETHKKAAMAEAAGATGGYTVPPDFYDKLLAIMAENSFIRSRAFVYPMTSATATFPYLDITTVQSAGTSPFFGGVKFNWTEEAQTRTETEPAFKMLELKAHELSGYSVSSNVFLQDAAFGLEAFLFQLFGAALAWYEEYAFLQGNGVGKPMGILNAARRH